MKPDHLTRAAQRLVRRLDELGRISDEPRKLTRTFLSPAMHRANVLYGVTMQENGVSKLLSIKLEDYIKKSSISIRAYPIRVLAAPVSQLLQAGQQIFPWLITFH